MDLYMIGNAHLDPVWLWQWQEGYAEVKATFQSALDRMNENPDFIFTCACAAYYEWVEENEPAMFEQITQRVKEGRWRIVGGMWIQPDMNVPSGESIARQLARSMQYFEKKFGVRVTTSYNVDTFGHSGFTPALLEKAGIANYVWMRPMLDENPAIPEGSMRWQAPNGSEVLAYRIPYSYNTKLASVGERMPLIDGMGQKLGQPMMCFYGVGNHGGGPTIADLAVIEEARKEDAGIRYACPDDFFAALDKEKLPVWTGELQHHASGCYSTDARSKAAHRQAENALVRAEKLSVLSGWLMGHKPGSMQQGWDNLFFNEFHDIMGGCAIHEAMGDAVMQLNESCCIAAREANAAIQKISWHVDTRKGDPRRIRFRTDKRLWHANGQGTPMVVFNPHGFTAKAPVFVRQGLLAVKDDQDNPIPVQQVRASQHNGAADLWDSVFLAEVPPLGYRLYWLFREGEKVQNAPLTVSPTLLENDQVKAVFTTDGALVELINKKTGKNLLDGACSAKLMDIAHTDTWAHYINTFDKEAGTFGDASIRVLEEGPVRGAIEVVTRYGASTLRQVYRLYAEGDALEVSGTLNMQEGQRMLKLCFPLSGRSGETLSEVTGGVLRRPATGEEEPCQRWFMQDELLVLNNGKYSYSATKEELRLTIAHTSLYADHYGQEHRDEQDEMMDLGRQHFAYTLKPLASSEEAALAYQPAALLNQPLLWVIETYHDGELPDSGSGIFLSDAAVELLTIKPAEDGNGLIVHVQEMGGETRTAEIALPMDGRSLRCTFKPYEIKAIRFPADASEKHEEVLLTELP